ncbi:hypothetical protein [Terricaulis silvestris]|uniref:Uncharacterized protein n=1 Tax=Terricaulis silvestris TaxID=2686094 RepID=A0A6I6MJZ7_9CAUL|nr:hypothetical protein [Terricaulis silvestris]QGZ93274.1 hypothetical protein DSM104635_00083 [Terricaulis silvestris]
MNEAQVAATRFCARVAGPFLILLGLMIFSRYETFPMLMPTMMQDAPLVMITGIWTLVLGLVFYTAHHHLGSAAATLLTMLALILVVRGAMLMVMPEVLINIAGQVADTHPMLLGITLVLGLLGAWLSYVGWFAKNV